MDNYYSKKLSAERLRLCYDIAPQRIRQYMKAEVEHVLSKIKKEDKVLDLGCGYGRIIPQLAEKARIIIGIDISPDNIQYGQIFLEGTQNCILMEMDASKLFFPNNTFDVVVCVQNGISAFHVDQHQLIKESIRVTKTGGKVLFSSYSDKIWEVRLNWFQLQSNEGLVGEIDYSKTQNGTIVCKDGFTATTVSPEEFQILTSTFDFNTNIIEVNESSIFCEITI